MKSKIVLIHFLPLELYPPVMNLLDYLSSSATEQKILVFTTKGSIDLIPYEGSNIKVIRFSPIIPTASLIKKSYRYLIFYFFTFFKIIKFKPKSILYYETLSALPALWYKKINRNVSILAHFHEIVLKKELDNSILLKYINQKESKYFKKYKWISQTNKDRMKIFTSLYGLKKDSSHLRILPNYPPLSWIEQPKNNQNQKDIIKLLYIGSLLETYVVQIVNRFGSDPKFSIDFYSHHFSNKVKELISSHNNCYWKGSINYKDIPNLKGLYDVGLIMYKGHSLNVRYCAPNKLFEYLALDLDVWCTDKLITARNYERLECYPKVVMVDYDNLNSFEPEKVILKEKLNYKPSPYFAEKVYRNILDVLCESS